MKTFIYSAFAIVLFGFAFKSTGFKKDQLRYPRVRTAFAEKEKGVLQMLSDKGIQTQSLKLAIMAYKEERIVEVWGTCTDKYELLTTYKFCSNSGTLGPKRKQGDLQIPEGIYKVDRFNPASNFYLSLGINYPNTSDRKRANGNAGGDIFIHGDCVTIGCIPITDDKVKELYTLCVLAKDAGNEIDVHFYPFKLTDVNMTRHSGNTHYSFWKELQPFYKHFNKKKTLANYRIAGDGKYLIVGVD
ncbi:MAG: L,D-transpeptidase family protein [Bacteroidia bacterium]